MSGGLKIAKDSAEVTSVKQEDLYVDSTTPLFKLYKTFNGTVIIAGTAGESKTVVLDHSLGYIPFFLLYCDSLPGGARTLIYGGYDTNSQFASGVLTVITSITKNSITWSIGGGGGTPIAGVYGYSCFIFYDRVDG